MKETSIVIMTKGLAVSCILIKGFGAQSFDYVFQYISIYVSG